GLLGVLEIQADVGPVAQEVAKTGQVLRGGNEQNVADPGQHQRRERVIHHGLVEDGEKLLARDEGQRVEARTGAAREDDTLSPHRTVIPWRSRRSPLEAPKNATWSLGQIKSFVRTGRSLRPRSSILPHYCAIWPFVNG